MPIWNQGSESLRDRINKEKGLNLDKDPGWCGAVATAMFLRGLSQERVKTADMPNEWDTPILLDENPYIISSGNLVETDFQQGGTLYSTLNRGISKVRSESIFKPQLIKKNSEYEFEITDDRGEFYSVNSDVLNQIELKNRIRKSKPAHIILVGRYSENKSIDSKLKCLKNTNIPFCTTVQEQKISYQRLDGHFLVINGYDGKYFKMYDPWGRIYNVSMNVETLDIEKDVEERSVPQTQVNLPGGNSFVGSNIGDTIKKSPSKIKDTQSLIGFKPLETTRRTFLNFEHVYGESGFASRYGKLNKLLVENILGWSLLRGSPVVRIETRTFQDNNNLPDVTGTQLTNPNAGLGNSFPSYQYMDDLYLGDKNTATKLDPVTPKQSQK